MSLGKEEKEDSASAWHNMGRDLSVSCYSYFSISPMEEALTSSHFLRRSFSLHVVVAVGQMVSQCARKRESLQWQTV